jgi:hypothetical protein
MEMINSKHKKEIEKLNAKHAASLSAAISQLHERHKSEIHSIQSEYGRHLCEERARTQELACMPLLQILEGSFKGIFVSFRRQILISQLNLSIITYEGLTKMQKAMVLIVLTRLPMMTLWMCWNIILWRKELVVLLLFPYSIFASRFEHVFNSETYRAFSYILFVHKH